MLWSGGEPSTWRCKSRRAVLGFWRELKLQMYAMYLDMWESRGGALEGGV
jgi:hypothetical protein